MEEDVKKESLVDYMLKVQETADYLIKGGSICNFDEETKIEIRDDEITREKKAFSICEYSIDDELEESCYGELKSILILMETIQDGEYERQVKGKLETGIYNIDAEFYKTTMNRAKSLLKYIAVAVISGRPIKLSEDELDDLKITYLDEEEMSFLEYEREGSLRYNVMKTQFEVVNSKGEVIIEDLPIENAIIIFTAFLEQQEKKKMRREAMKPYLDKKDKKDEEER